MFVMFLKLRIATILLFTIAISIAAGKCVTKSSGNRTSNSTEDAELMSDKSNLLLLNKIDKMTELLEQSLEYQKMNFWANVKYYHCQTLGLQLCVRYFQEASTKGKVQL